MSRRSRHDATAPSVARPSNTTAHTNPFVLSSRHGSLTEGCFGDQVPRHRDAGPCDEGIVMCSSALGTTTTIPACPSPQVIHNGTCAQSCPAQFEANNGYCTPLAVPTLYADAFDILIATNNGGYRDRGISVSDGSLSVSAGCGFGTYPTTDGAEFRRLLEDAVRNAGGTISLSTPSSWCGPRAEKQTAFCVFRTKMTEVSGRT